MKCKSIIFEDIVFTPYDQYELFEDSTIRIVEGSRLSSIIDIVHSSNGYDYVCLRTINGENKLYKLDVLMVITFKRDELYKNIQYDSNNKPHYKIIHIDGNNRNNNLSNLRVEKDYEEWKPLIYPDDIIKNKYEISSWGRIRLKSVGRKHARICQQYNNHNGYPQVTLKHITENGKESSIPKFVHKLVALHFILNPNPTEFTVLDHINGNKQDYAISNLHWVTQKMNILLCTKYGRRGSSISTFEVDMITRLLLELNGSIEAVYNNINHIAFPNITKAIINNIKQKDSTYIRHDGKYDLKNVEFVKRTRKPDLTDNEIETICQQLVACKFDLSSTLQKLHEMGLTHLEKHDVRHIRDKSKRCDISDKYFSRDDYEHPKAPMTDDVVVLVCKTLVKHGGNIAKATREMNDTGHTEVNKFHVQDIKYKKRGVSISDRFFIYENKEFKCL